MGKNVVSVISNCPHLLIIITLIQSDMLVNFREGLPVPHKPPYGFPKYFDRVKYTDMCEKLTSGNYAYIIIYIKSPTMMQLIKDVRLSFEDKLGILGGTIGVFTGISFITMVEIVYWIIITIYEKCHYRTKGEKKSNGQNNNGPKNVSLIELKQ